MAAIPRRLSLRCWTWWLESFVLSCFVRVGDPIGSGSIEMVRYDDGAYLKAAAQIIGEMLTDSFGANPGNGPGTQEARLETEVYRLSRSEPATTMKLTGS